MIDGEYSSLQGFSTKSWGLHAMHLQVLLSQEPDVEYVVACPSSTARQGGTHSQCLHWGAVKCQKAQPQDFLTFPRGLHSNIPDPVKKNKGPSNDKFDWQIDRTFICK